MSLPCYGPCVCLLFLSHTLCRMGFQSGPISAQWERWGARNGKTKGAARDWGEAVQICKTTQKTSPPPWILSPRKPPGGWELRAMQAVHSPVLQPGHTAPVWEGAQHPGKGFPLPTLCKAPRLSPIFWLSWGQKREGEGRHEENVTSVFNTETSTCKQYTNALFPSELYKQVTAYCIFKNTIDLITSNQWVTSVPGNYIKQKRHRYLKVINWDSRFIDLIVLSPVICTPVSGINHQCKIIPEIFTIPSTAMVNMKNVIRYSNSRLSQF